MTSSTHRHRHQLWHRFHRFLVAAVLLPVVFYRRVLSPLKRAPSCIYLPTCSEYALEAVKTRGIVVGIALSVARLLRCNPLFHGGYHPVPAPATRTSDRILASTGPALAGPALAGLTAHRCAHQVQEQH